MRPCLLDTDILSEFLRDHPRVVAKVGDYLQEHGSVSFSVITYYEILNGLLYKDARKQLSRFAAFAGLSNIIPLTPSMAKAAAEIQADLRKSGAEIGHTDTLIAGVAMVSDLQLITNNTAHFQRVKGLSIANWTQ